MNIITSTFYFVMYATPGPNNAMILSSGIQFGFLRTLPHMAGITIGHVIQLILVCLGFGSIFTIIPELQTVLKIFCSMYICFLSYRLLGSLNISQKETSRPLKFYEGAIFQLANPKAWTISMCREKHRTAIHIQNAVYVSSFVREAA